MTTHTEKMMCLADARMILSRTGTSFISLSLDEAHEQATELVGLGYRVMGAVGSVGVTVCGVSEAGGEAIVEEAIAVFILEKQARWLETLGRLPDMRAEVPALK